MAHGLGGSLLSTVAIRNSRHPYVAFCETTVSAPLPSARLRPNVQPLQFTRHRPKLCARTSIL